MDVKEKALKHCLDYIAQKRALLQQRTKALQESLNSETKSSAGDKHETGRAMVQLEQEKLGKQSMELEKMARVLDQVDIGANTGKVSLGSLVATSTAVYFVAISSGAMNMANGKSIFCISPSSPIAQAMFGKETGDSFVFNGIEHHITALT